MNENISDDEGGDSIDPFDPNVTDQDDSKSPKDLLKIQWSLQWLHSEFVEMNFSHEIFAVSVKM